MTYNNFAKRKIDSSLDNINENSKKKKKRKNF